MVIAAVAAGAFYFKPSAPARATRFEVTLPEGVQFSQYVSVSPDGHKLVFNATGEKSGLWVRDLDTLEWRHLTGTEGSSSPFWSPDSRFLGFSVGRELKKIEVAGGPPQTLCTSPSTVGTGTWSKDNVIVFGGKPNGPLRRVPAAGGVPSDVTAVDQTRGEVYNVIPSFLPDGKHFVYVITGTPEVAGAYVGSLDAKPAEQSKDRLVATRLGVSYADGNLFFLRDGTLMAQPFDTASSSCAGSLSPSRNMWGRSYRRDFLRCLPRGFWRTGWEPAPRAACSTPGSTARARRPTFRQSLGSYPVWSSDGSRIAFAAGDAVDTIYEKSASGAGEEKELLKKTDEIKLPSSWSHDGRFLLYYTFSVPKTGSDLWVLPLMGQETGDREPVLLLGTDFNESLGSFSPDMRWIAYVSNESGRGEVYVRPFVASVSSGPGSSEPKLGEGKWQVSRDGGTNPRWRADGKEIIFNASTGAGVPIMSVEVNGSGAAFQMGTPKQLFLASGNSGWDVTADGQRFMMIVSPGQGQQGPPTPITVVLNWQADLKK